MRIAVAIHAGRVSPVLDVAQRLLVVETEGGAAAERHEVPLTGQSLATQVREIQAVAADALICGAVSRPLEAALVAAGVHVVPQVCGAIDDVVGAYLSDNLMQPAFLMPGCCGRRRQRAGCGRQGERGPHGRRAGRRHGAND
jgi:predicted Fe-Mo cluster-binding NifX family protein